MNRSIPFLLFLMLFFLLQGCAEKPGDPSTTGLKQYIDDGFAIKYPDNTTLDLKGSDERVLRTVTLTGEVIELEMASNKITIPAYEIVVEWYDNPGVLDAASFAHQYILTGFQQAATQDSPTGYWPVNEAGEVEGRIRTVHGIKAWESAFNSGDHNLIRTYITNGDKAISVGYREYPVENNPLQPAWHAAYIFTLDSIRLQ